MKKEETKVAVEEKKPVAEFDFETFEINALEDYVTWNIHARRAHKKARLTDKHAQPPYPIKIPDERFHKKAKVKFQRFDQPENVLKVRVRNKDIDWTGQLKPGCIYDLPLPVIRFLNRLAVPIFAEVKVENGGEVRSETKQVGERSRFSCQVIDMD